jgi:hypothetical protein
MISSDEFGLEFVTFARDEAIISALRRVTGASRQDDVRENYLVIQKAQ